VPRAKYRTVPVKEETFQKLEGLKELLKAKSWDELLGALVERHWGALAEEARKAVCRELREARGPLQAWARLLLKRLPPALLPEALQYLKPAEDKDIYVADPEKCGKS